MQGKLTLLQEELEHLQEGARESGVREERDSLHLLRAQREARTVGARCTALQEQLQSTEDKLEFEKKKREDLTSQLGKFLNSH